MITIQNNGNDHGIVMEFKHAKEDNSQNISKLASKALNQVR
ncbi:hypothetical protein [Cysteiniphilum halobium]|nr:hypothetical protein [Cysteiniphilum halobium]